MTTEHRARLQLAAAVATPLIVAGVIGAVLMGQRIAKLEEAVGVAPGAAIVERLSRAETKIEDFAKPGPRWTLDNAREQEDRLRAEIAGVRGECLAAVREVERRVSGLHNHAGGKG